MEDTMIEKEYEQKIKDFAEKSDIHANLPIVEALESISEKLKILSEKETVINLPENKLNLEGLVTVTDEHLIELITPLIPEPIAGKDGKNGKDGVSPDIGTIIYEASLATEERLKPFIPNTQDIITEVLLNIPPVETSEETPEETADRLNTKEEIIEQETIIGLTKRFDDLEKKINKKSTTSVIGGATGGGHTAKVHDLSDSLNGVTKTFALPAFWRVLNVYSTSSPVIFRPTTDYTTDASAMTITFTSEINEAATLSAGQTLLVLYSE